MNLYQINYLARNILDKAVKIFINPRLFRLYFNEYLKGIFINSDIDSYIVSYPKCGRTWLYNILSLYSKKNNTQNTLNNRKLVKFNNTLVKFVHDCSDPSPYPIKPTKYRNKDLINKKKIILIRDPREVIVSHWYHLHFREKTFKQNISEFIDDEYLGIEKIITFYNFINLISFTNSKIITYENLVNNTFEEVKSILYFLNLKIDENLIRNCISECSFEKLQKQEMKETKNKDIKTMKFRKGTYGNFSNDLDQNDLTKINDKIRILLNNNFKSILNLENM